MRKLKILSVFILIVLFFINTLLVIGMDPYSKNKLALFSLSKGNLYVARLNLWRLFIDNRQWDLADKQEKYLDPSDLVVYKAKYHPEELKKQLNNLAVKSDKTVEDYIEMAKLYHRLGKDSDAQNSLLLAKNTDPIRDDINALFFESQAK